MSISHMSVEVLDRVPMLRARTSPWVTEAIQRAEWILVEGDRGSFDATVNSDCR